MITFDRVTKTYATSTRPALDKVSAEIGKGEFVFLIGPSGSGKSTFLRLMVRKEKPDSETLTINGNDVATLSNRQVPKHRQKIGNLDPETSGEIMLLLDRINRMGTTVVMSTHDNDSVDAMRRRVLELDNGKLVRDDATGVYGLGR